MVFDKARPLRRTESPKGASPNNRSARRTKDDEPTENGHAQPCVPEGGEYRTVQLLHRWAFRWSTGLPDFTVSPIYQFTSLPINQSTGIRWASPSGAFPCGIGRSVGSSGKPSSRYGYSNPPPSGTPQLTRGSGRIYTCNTEGTTQTRHNVPIRHRGMMQTKSRPYAARSPRRGLLPIAVGEEDEGRRTYGTHVYTAARPRRGRISVTKSIGSNQRGRRLHFAVALLERQALAGTPNAGGQALTAGDDHIHLSPARQSQ